MSDLDSSWSLSVAQWKPRLRLLHWGFVAVGAATTAGGIRVIILSDVVKGNATKSKMNLHTLKAFFFNSILILFAFSKKIFQL